jgi:hypothetical protein
VKSSVKRVYNTVHVCFGNLTIEDQTFFVFWYNSFQC